MSPFKAVKEYVECESVNTLANEVDGLRNALDVRDMEIKKLKQQIAGHKGHQARQKGIIDTLTLEKQFHIDECKVLEKKLNTYGPTLKKEIECLNLQIEDKDKKINELDFDLVDMAKQYRTERLSRVKAEDTIADLEERLFQARSQEKALEGHVNARDTIIEKLLDRLTR